MCLPFAPLSKAHSLNLGEGSESYFKDCFQVLKLFSQLTQRSCKSFKVSAQKYMKFFLSYYIDTDLASFDFLGSPAIHCNDIIACFGGQVGAASHKMEVQPAHKRFTK